MRPMIFLLSICCADENSPSSDEIEAGYFQRIWWGSHL